MLCPGPAGGQLPGQGAEELSKSYDNTAHTPVGQTDGDIEYRKSPWLDQTQCFDYVWPPSLSNTENSELHTFLKPLGSTCLSFLLVP